MPTLSKTIQMTRLKPTISAPRCVENALNPRGDVTDEFVSLKPFHAARQPPLLVRD